VAPGWVLLLCLEFPDDEDSCDPGAGGPAGDDVACALRRGDGCQPADGRWMAGAGDGAAGAAGGVPGGAEGALS